MEDNNAQNVQIFYDTLIPLINLLPPAQFTLQEIADDGIIVVEFTCEENAHTGHVVIKPPNNEGDIIMLISVDRFNGYFTELQVNEHQQIIEAILFTQELLQHQPDEDDLKYIRVPIYMLNSWCVPDNYRNFVINGYIYLI